MAKVITVTEKDGVVTTSVETTSVNTVTKAVSKEDAAIDLEVCETRHALLTKLKNIVIKDEDAIDLFYYMEKLAYKNKLLLADSLTEDIAYESDLMAKLKAVLPTSIEE